MKQPRKRTSISLTSKVAKLAESQRKAKERIRKKFTSLSKHISELILKEDLNEQLPAIKRRRKAKAATI